MESTLSSDFEFSTEYLYIEIDDFFCLWFAGFTPITINMDWLGSRVDYSLIWLKICVDNETLWEKEK